MKLPYDVLLHVIWLSGYTKNAVRLMATCRVLYHEGPKIAFKKPIVIYTAEQLDSFLKFLRADNSSRCRYLKHLELREFYLESDVVEEIIDTLPLLTSLEALRLEETDQFLDLDPDLIPALYSITTLRYIDFAGARGETCALLQGLRSPLVSARIDFLRDDELKLSDFLSDDEWEKSHPTMLLGNFADTLEELRCVAWQTDEDTIIPEKVYPNMRKLSIESPAYPLRIDPFIRAFPNLTDLYVNTEYHEGHYSEGILESHKTNVAQQLDVVNTCGTWEHLKRFRGCLFDLYAIGITSHINRVTIVDVLEDRSTTMMLATVLRYARPVHLKLEGITGAILGDADQGFVAMLRHPSASGLINLDVRIHFKAEDRGKNLGAVIDGLVSALTCLPLKLLELEFVTRDLEPTQGRLQARTASPTVAEHTLRELDMDALIARLEAMPSLEAAHVVLPSSRGDHDFRWDDHDRTIMKDARS